MWILTGDLGDPGPSVTVTVTEELGTGRDPAMGIMDIALEGRRKRNIVTTITVTTVTTSMLKHHLEILVWVKS